MHVRRSGTGWTCQGDVPPSEWREEEYKQGKLAQSIVMAWFSEAAHPILAITLALPDS